MTRYFAILALVFGLAACEKFEDLDQAPEPMGRFLLGHNIVVVSEPEIGPLSRTASDEDWKLSVESAITERFSRYDGDKYFHIAVKLEGYALALPGIPIVASPKSLLIVTVSVWDDETGEKTTEEPETFTVFERASGETIISSGLTQTKEQQMENLSRNAAKMIHDWMLEHPEWFGDAALMDPETTSAGWARPALDETGAPLEPGAQPDVQPDAQPDAEITTEAIAQATSITEE